MNEDLISEFIKECTNTFNEIKNKNNYDINNSLECCLNNLIAVKEKISRNDKNSISPLLLLASTKNFIEATNNIINLKYSKYFLSILIVLKKFIEYKFFAKEKSFDIILILISFYNYPKIKEDCKKKILEIIQTYIFSDYIEIKYDSLALIYILILKEFNVTNYSKNKDFKNPIRLLFTTITDQIYKSNDDNTIIQITYFIFFWYDLSLIESNQSKIEGIIYNNIKNELKDEIIDILNKNKNNIYIQCLSLELLSQGFSIIIQNKAIDDKTFNNFIKEQIINVLSVNINKIKNNFSINEDEKYYLNYLKICKFLKILLFNFNINYAIIQSIIDVLIEEEKKQNKIYWKINLSFELLSQIISNYELLCKIYTFKKEQIKIIFSSISDFMCGLNDVSIPKNIDDSKIKNIYENKIYLEGDEIFIFREENIKYFKSKINESIQHLIDSLMKMNINGDNKNVDSEKFYSICDYLKYIIFKLFSKEFYNDNRANNKVQNESYNELKIYINYIKSLLILYNNLNNSIKKNEILKFLCNSALNFPNNNPNEEKNIYIAVYLLDLMKEIKLLNRDSFVILLQTIEVFNTKYNYLKMDEYIKNDINKIINDTNIYLDINNKKVKKHSKIRIEIKIKEEDKTSNNNEIIEKIEIQKGLKKKESKESKEDNNYINKLCKEINELFLDKKIYAFEYIKCIFDSLSICIDLSVQKMKNNNIKNNLNEKNNVNKDNIIINNLEEKNNQFIYEINFYFSKIISLTLLYLDNIYILFDPLISVINKLFDNKLMLEFSFDVLCAIIPEILLKYERIKNSINKNITEENKIWLNEKWQKLLFSPLLTLLSQPELFHILKPKIFISIKKIIQKSGNYIDSYGWDAILQAFYILSNYNIENTFLIIKEILNDYNEYLSIFNIIPIMKLLNLFIYNEKDKNMNFSSIELFWSCANLIEDYKQEKLIVTEHQKLYFINLIKDKDIKTFCDELFFNLFSYLNDINSNNSSIEVKKSILNIFTEIFVSKLSSISDDISLKIINDIFFISFEVNSDKYISDNKNLEFEKILETSIFGLIKILKEYFNEKEKQKGIYEKYLNKIIEIIPIGSCELINDILKSLIEIKTSKNSDIPLIETKTTKYFEILSLIIAYLNSKNFILNKNNKVQIYRLFKSILSYLNFFPGDKKNSNENAKNLFIIIDTLLICTKKLETNLLESKPGRILDFEEEIFNFLENIKIPNNFVFNYLFNKMNLDLTNLHSVAICRKSFESIHNLISKNIKDKYINGIDKEGKEIICKYIEKVKNLMNMRNNNGTIEFIIKSNNNINNIKNEINFDKYLESFIKIINEICINVITIGNNKEHQNENEGKETLNNIFEIFLVIFDTFEMMFKQSINEYKSIDKSYQAIIVNEIYQNMDILSSNFIMNKLLYYILIIFGNEKNQYDKLEKKLIHIIKLISDISYENNINNGESSFISLNHFFINELFKLCKYKTNEQIINVINVFKIKVDEEKFIQNYIGISKLLTNLLINKIIEILKKYRDDENKSGGMPLNRGRILEIISLLKNVKDLEIYPNFNDEKINEIQSEKRHEITIFDVFSKSKKVHLFYIQPILNDLIFSKDNSVKCLVKDIFNDITNIIELPKLINFDE